MDRRQFLKLTGAAAAASVISPATELSAARKKGRTPLETKGYVKEPVRQIPMVDSADVVVLGGGPAGFAAAGVAAALAVISRCSCRDVDIPTLQKRLKAQNVKL